MPAMGQEFTELRRRAREKRDKLIADATKEYFDVLVKIATLEQDILGRVPTNKKTVLQCVRQVMPKDRPFTTSDLKALLRGLDALRDWGTRAINDAVYRLMKTGKIRR